MTQLIRQLQIIAEPKPIFRDRYESELHKSGNLAKRYIRAEDGNQHKLEYPTIEVKKSTIILILIDGEKKSQS
jgi:hypothetical protein